MKHAFQNGQRVRTSRKVYGKTEQHAYIPENTPCVIGAIYADWNGGEPFYAVKFDQREYGQGHTLLESSLTDGGAIMETIKTNGLERFFAPIHEIVNFMEWMADQPCTAVIGSNQRCRDIMNDLAWCCAPCRAAILRYGHEVCKAPIPPISGQQ